MSLQIFPTEQFWSLLASDEIIDFLVKSYTVVEIIDFYHNLEKRWATIIVLSPDHHQQFLREGIKTAETITPASSVRPKTHVHNPQCKCCYQLGHQSKACTLEQVCSKCAAKGHFHINLLIVNQQQPSAATVVAHTLISTTTAPTWLNIVSHF